MLSDSRLPPRAWGVRAWIFCVARRTRQISHCPPDRRSTMAATFRGTYRLRRPCVGPLRRLGRGPMRGSRTESQSRTNLPKVSPSVIHRGSPLDIRSRARWNPSFAALVTRKRSGRVGSPCRASSTARTACSCNARGGTVHVLRSHSRRSSGLSSIAGSSSTFPTDAADSAGTFPERTRASSSGAATSVRPNASRRHVCRGPKPTSAAQASTDAKPCRT